MKIRRYLGKDTQEAILKVKMDLGSDAIILNTRKVRQKGLLKIFAKPMIEVLAAIDDDYGKTRTKVLSKQEEKNPVAAAYNPVETGSAEKNVKIEELENKINNMESMLGRIFEEVCHDRQKTAAAGNAAKQQTVSGIMLSFYNNLIKNEVEAEIAKHIIKTAGERVGENAAVNESIAVLSNIIADLLGRPEAIRLREDGKPTVAIFIGPTGVGKTTTLAKIAASYSLNHGKNVALLTADTYRIAAVEQLKTYAEILGIPVSVIYSPSEMKEAIDGHFDKDLILVDTAGRSYRNKSHFEELKALVNVSDADEVFLVLSATTGTRNCKEILNNYSFLKKYKLIFTKLDETPITGIILNTRYITGKYLSYMTTGQNVPDDIEMANIEKIIKNLLGSIR